jgi:hypothetical protein
MLFFLILFVVIAISSWCKCSHHLCSPDFSLLFLSQFICSLSLNHDFLLLFLLLFIILSDNCSKFLHMLLVFLLFIFLLLLINTGKNSLFKLLLAFLVFLSTFACCSREAVTLN